MMLGAGRSLTCQQSRFAPRIAATSISGAITRKAETGIDPPSTEITVTRATTRPQAGSLRIPDMGADLVEIVTTPAILPCPCLQATHPPPFHPSASNREPSSIP